MLRDVFPCLLKDGEVIESATIWEASRICVLPAAGQSERGTCGTHYVLAELLAGVANVANLTGLTQVVPTGLTQGGAVCDARILRLLKAVGCNPQIIGTPCRIGDTMSFAGLFEMREAFRLAVRAGLGIDGSIVAAGAKELAFQ